MVALAAFPVKVGGFTGTGRETAPGQFVFCFPDMDYRDEPRVEELKRLLEQKGYVKPVVIAGRASRNMEIFRLEQVVGAPRRG